MATENRRWCATVTHRPLIGIAIGSLYRFKRKLCHPIVNERISLFNVYRIQRKIKIPVLTLLLLFSSHSVLLELLLFLSLSLSRARIHMQFNPSLLEHAHQPNPTTRNEYKSMSGLIALRIVYLLHILVVGRKETN